MLMHIENNLLIFSFFRMLTRNRLLLNSLMMLLVCFVSRVILGELWINHENIFFFCDFIQFFISLISASVNCLVCNEATWHGSFWLWFFLPQLTSPLLTSDNRSRWMLNGNHSECQIYSMKILINLNWKDKHEREASNGNCETRRTQFRARIWKGGGGSCEWNPLGILGFRIGNRIVTCKIFNFNILLFKYCDSIDFLLLQIASAEDQKKISLKILLELKLSVVKLKLLDFLIPETLSVFFFFRPWKCE